MTTIDLDAEFAALKTAYPAWHPWQGVAGLLYARRPRSSPPVVKRDTTPAGLRRQVAQWEAENAPPVILG